MSYGVHFTSLIPAIHGYHHGYSLNVVLLWHLHNHWEVEICHYISIYQMIRT